MTGTATNPIWLVKTRLQLDRNKATNDPTRGRQYKNSWDVVKQTLRHEGIEDGDLLVAQIRPKGRAASGELVICKVGETIYIGRWWQKHGRRALLTDGPSEVITGTATGSLKVVAAINAIVRPEK